MGGCDWVWLGVDGWLDVGGWVKWLSPFQFLHLSNIIIKTKLNSVQQNGCDDVDKILVFKQELPKQFLNFK